MRGQAKEPLLPTSELKLLKEGGRSTLHATSVLLNPARALPATVSWRRGTIPARGDRWMVAEIDHFPAQLPPPSLTFIAATMMEPRHSAVAQLVLRHNRGEAFSQDPGFGLDSSQPFPAPRELGQTKRAIPDQSNATYAFLLEPHWSSHWRARTLVLGLHAHMHAASSMPLAHGRSLPLCPDGAPAPLHDARGSSCNRSSWRPGLGPPIQLPIQPAWQHQCREKRGCRQRHRSWQRNGRWEG
jgi:hypothetical protein